MKQKQTIRRSREEEDVQDEVQNMPIRANVKAQLGCNAAAARIVGAGRVRDVRSLMDLADVPRSPKEEWWPVPCAKKSKRMTFASPDPFSASSGETHFTRLRLTLSQPLLLSMKQIRTLLHQQSNAKHDISKCRSSEPPLRVPFKVLTLIDHGTVSPPCLNCYP